MPVFIPQEGKIEFLVFCGVKYAFIFDEIHGFKFFISATELKESLINFPTLLPPKTIRSLLGKAKRLGLAGNMLEAFDKILMIEIPAEVTVPMEFKICNCPISLFHAHGKIIKNGQICYTIINNLSDLLTFCIRAVDENALNTQQAVKLFQDVTKNRMSLTSEPYEELFKHLSDQERLLVSVKHTMLIDSIIRSQELYEQIIPISENN